MKKALIILFALIWIGSGISGAIYNHIYLFHSDLKTNDLFPIIFYGGAAGPLTWLPNIRNHEYKVLIKAR